MGMEQFLAMYFAVVGVACFVDNKPGSGAVFMLISGVFAGVAISVG